MVVVFTVLPNIAANTWLSVWPLMADTVFMLSFHNVWEGLTGGERIVAIKPQHPAGQNPAVQGWPHVEVVLLL